MGTGTATDLAKELNDWLVGGGIITMALFPLAIPLLALTAVAVIPLLVIPLVGGLVAALVAVPVLLVRGLARRVLRAFRALRKGTAGRGATPVHRPA
jgi:hypothetical protein